MNIIKEKDKLYEVVKKPISVDGLEQELRQLKEDKRTRGFEVYDESIRELEKKIKLIKEL